LIKTVPNLHLARYHGQGSHVVQKPRWSATEGAVYINHSQYFAPIPSDVWEFRIGGYQVLMSYLKTRKGRALSLDEITNVMSISNVLSYTTEHLKKIQSAYASAFQF